MSMQRNVIAVLALGLVGLISASQSAQARVGVGLSVFGALVYPQKVDMTAATGVDSALVGKLGFGGGGLLSLRFNPYLGIEAGAAYLMRKYGITVAGVDSGTDLTAKSVYIPAGIRIHLHRMFSLQAGAYYDVSAESGGGSTYGVDGGLRFSIPLGTKVALFVEGRYDYSLKAEEINGVSLKAHDLVNGFVGLTFGGGFGGK